MKNIVKARKMHIYPHTDVKRICSKKWLSWTTRYNGHWYDHLRTINDSPARVAFIDSFTGAETSHAWTQSQYLLRINQATERLTRPSQWVLHNYNKFEPPNIMAVISGDLYPPNQHGLWSIFGRGYWGSIYPPTRIGARTQATRESVQRPTN